MPLTSSSELTNNQNVIIEELEIRPVDCEAQAKRANPIPSFLLTNYSESMAPVSLKIIDSDMARANHGLKVVNKCRPPLTRHAQHESHRRRRARQ